MINLYLTDTGENQNKLMVSVTKPLFSTILAWNHLVKVQKGILIGFLLVSPLGAASNDLMGIARGVDLRYNHLHTLEADFIEIYTGAGTERTESGTLRLKKPGKMRWEYRSPKEKLFLSDGKEAWFFIPGEKQARKLSVRQLDDLRSPLAFLLGKSRLQKELKGLAITTDVFPLAAGNTVLRGVPVGMEDRLSQVVLEIALDNEIVRIVLYGTDESLTEYRFSNQKEDVPMPDQSFHFNPPPGVETVDGDFPQ